MQVTGASAYGRVGTADQSRRSGASWVRFIAMRLATVATSIARTMKPSDCHVVMTGTCEVKDSGSHYVSRRACRNSFTPMKARIAAMP